MKPTSQLLHTEAAALSELNSTRAARAAVLEPRPSAMRCELRDARVQDSQREVTAWHDVTALLTQSLALCIHRRSHIQGHTSLFYPTHVADYRTSTKCTAHGIITPPELCIWQESFCSAESHQQLPRDRHSSSTPTEPFQPSDKHHSAKPLGWMLHRKTPAVT